MLFSLIGLVLRIISLGMFVYCIMSFLMPSSSIYTTLGRYVEPVLTPVRNKLWQWFPKLRTLPVDISPLAIWLAIDILLRLINAR